MLNYNPILVIITPQTIFSTMTEQELVVSSMKSDAEHYLCADFLMITGQSPVVT